MPSLRSSPSGPAVSVGGSSDLENVSAVEGVTISDALENLISPEAVTLYDDFIGGGNFVVGASPNNTIHIGDLNWTFLVAGNTLGLARNGNGQGNFRGLYYWNTQASTNRNALMLGTPSLTAESVERVVWRASLNTVANFGSNRRCGLGAGNGVNFSGDGLAFEHQPVTANGITGSANVQCAAYKGGVRTAVISSIPAPLDTFMIFELRRTAPLTWEYYVNGVLAATLSGNAIPTAKVTPGAQLTGVINLVTAIGVDTFEITYRRKRSLSA